jgi:hypothetical protein
MGAKDAAQRFMYRLARTRANPRRLEWYGWKAHSQSDEDGIIAQIFHRIGTTNRTFVEFGAEVGTENNTRHLLDAGWSGLWIEGNPEYAGSIRWNFRDQIGNGQLKFTPEFVDRDNINGLIQSAGISGEIDLLSIDIDGNDYHVFEAIDVIRPRLVVLDHNHAFQPPVDWVMPYDPQYRWDAASGVAGYGASLTAMTRLARSKGYELIGCGLYSANGFYLRSDLVRRRFSGPHTPERYFNPLWYDNIVSFPKRSRIGAVKARRQKRPTGIYRQRDLHWAQLSSCSWPDSMMI